MNTLKRISAIVLAIVMVLSLGLTVFADEAPAATYKIKVTQNANDDATHTWKAYQIFTGKLADLDGKETLSDVQWGLGVDYTNAKTYKELGEKTLVQALKAELSAIFGSLADNASAADVAKALEKASDADAKVFADVVANYLTANVAGTATTHGKGDSSEITGLVAGYYLVRDEMTEAEGEHGAYSDYILQVVDNVEVTAKTDVPSVEKKIVEGGKEVDYNEVGVGETVTYHLKSFVPDMKDYKGYWFIYHDLLSKGLTYKGGVTVTVYEPDAEDPTKIATPENKITLDTEVSTNTVDEGTEIEIVLKNFFEQCKDRKGWIIVVEYTAEVNKDAVIGSEGNPNTVDLEYSNNPNYDYDGDKPTGDEGKVTGRTPKDIVKSYTTALEIIKVDDKDNRLVGAEFSIKGTVAKKVIVEKDEYTQDNENGTYYLLKDGTYTNQNPNEIGEVDNKEELLGKYVDATGSTKYTLEHKKEIVEGDEEEVELVGTVGSDGVLRFSGLADGTYTIKEVKAPDGYNLLKDEITLVVESTDMSLEGCKWVVGNGSDEKWTVLNDYLYQISVENKKGAQLPETGGMGTTIFYIVGGIMLLAAMAVCVSKVLSPKVKSTKVATEI